MGLDGKKTKLKFADICKVDLVPAGAQQDSRIAIIKSADEKGFMAKILESIQKTLTSFTVVPIEKEVENFDDEMWTYTYALRESIKSIIDAEDVNKIDSVKTTIEQFSTAIEAAIPKWLNGEKVMKSEAFPDRLDKFKEMHKSLSDLIDTRSQVVKTIDNIKPNKAGNKEGSDNNMAEINKASLPQDVQDYITSLEVKVAKAAPVVIVPEDIYKGLSESVVKMLKDSATQTEVVKKQNDQLAQTIAKMADDNLIKEYVAKAATFDKLGLKAEEFGAVLKSIATVSPEVYAKVEAVLKTANEAIAKGNLFTEIGSKSSNGAAITKEDAWSQIVALADARVVKGESDSKTQAQAVEAVMKTVEGQKLYTIYITK